MKLHELKDVGGTYVAVIPVGATVQLLQTWAASQNLAPRENYHVTVMYSRTKLPNLVPYTREHFSTVVGTELFEDGSMVLLLDAPSLVARHEQLMARGGTYDFPTYRPHLTLGKGTQEQLNTLTLPNFALVLGDEYWEPLDLTKD